MKSSSRNVKQPYIGGSFASGDDDNFLSQKTDNSLFPAAIGNRNRMFFETGSDAIAAQIKGLTELWLPENFCHETVNRILRKSKNVKPIYYKQPQEALAGDKERALLLLHFNKFDAGISEFAKANLNAPNLFIIEDFVQAPFDVSKAQAHSAVISFRKIGTVETAIAYTANEIKTGKYNSDYLQLKHQAMQLREEFLRTGDAAKENEYLQKMQAANEAENNSGIYLAGEDEKNHFAEINFAAIKKQRQTNRKTLENALRSRTEFEILPSDYFFLMLRLKNRDVVRKALFEQGIFSPIHWADSGHASDLLSLPIDQRYDENDMQRQATAFLDAVKIK